MAQDKIVIINGRRYDAKTGLPLANVPKRPTKPSVDSRNVHSLPQRSKTLVRKIAKKPTRQNTATSPNQRLGRVMDIAKSSKISRFASTAKPAQQTVSKPATKDIEPQKHPIVQKAIAKSNTNKPALKTPKEIKNDAISAALAKPQTATHKKSFFVRHPKSITIIVVSAIIALLGGYLTYVNMPNLSVKFASLRAGIEASYPEYHPDGYSIDGPVSYSDGEVVIKFKANTGSSKFVIKQTESTWDSSAVLDNIVKKKAGGDYITSQERGLTIYTYGGNGAWVNGGILYTIEGDAPLSIEQIRRIATSM